MRWSPLLVVLGLLSPATHAAPSSARFAEARSRAVKAVAALGQDPAPAVEWSALRARPAAVRNLNSRSAGSTDEERARRFLRRHPALFVAADPTSLRFVDIQAAGGRRVVRFQQVACGVPVEGHLVVVALEGKDVLRSVASEADAGALASGRPRLRGDEAVRRVLRHIGAPEPAGSARLSGASLRVLAEGDARLAYRVLLPLPVDPGARIHWVDASTGEYLGWRRGILIDGPRLPVEVRR